MTTLRGGTVFDSATGETRREDVAVEDGRISAVGANLPSKSGEDIDAANMTIFPGLINMHEHLTLKRTWGPMWRQTKLEDPYLVIRGVRAALSDVMQGVTTVRDVAAPHHLNIYLKRAIAVEMFPGPRVFAAGAPISITGGHAWPISTEADGPDGMRVAVRRTIKAGADWIKLITSNDPSPEEHDGQWTHAEFTRDELAAAAQAAHGWHRKITAHAMGRDAIGFAIDAGVDSIEHGIYLDRPLADRMVAAGVALIPTISGYHENTKPHWQRGPNFDTNIKLLVDPSHKDSARIAIEAGVRVGVGTDTIGDIVDEITFLTECGMSPAQALSAATHTNAQILGWDDRIGQIKPGMIADLFVVRGNPLTDLQKLRSVEWVMRSGIPLRPSEVRLPTQDETAQWTSLALVD